MRCCSGQAMGDVHRAQKLRESPPLAQFGKQLGASLMPKILAMGFAGKPKRTKGGGLGCPKGGETHRVTKNASEGKD